MAYIDWNDGLATGSTEIDDQHKKLISLINQLFDAMRLGKGTQVLGKVFEELLAYTDYHFSTEERLFGPVDYPEKEAHMAAHRGFVAKALELQDKYKAGTAFMTIETLDFLKNWVVEHVLQMDHTYKGLIK